MNLGHCLPAGQTILPVNVPEGDSMPITKVNGIALHYIIAGEENEKTLLCFHSYSGKCQDYAGQLKGLMSQYRVIAIDQRGSGNSAAPKEEEDYSMEIFASDGFELLQQLGIKKS